MFCVLINTWMKRKPTFTGQCLRNVEYTPTENIFPRNGKVLTWKVKENKTFRVKPTCLMFISFMLILFWFILCFLEFVLEETACRRE